MPEPQGRVCEHRLRRRVQFHETDAAGIVHFSRFFLYMEEAEHALWRSAGLSIAPRGSAIGWPRTAVSFEYHRPLRFEDEVDVVLRIVAIEERTIRYSCVVLRGEERIASGGMTVTCATKAADDRMRATAIPADVVSRFGVSPKSGPVP